MALERLKQPRRFTPEQRERVKKVIVRFPNMVFDVSVTADPETMEFAADIEECLLSAGWKEVTYTVVSNNPAVENHPLLVQSARSGNEWGMSVSSGLTIQVAQPKWKEWGDGVLALVQAMKAEGLQLDAQTFVNGNANAVHIKVGTKP